MDVLLAESVERLLKKQCGPSTVRSIEAGGSTDTLWQAINDSGFADAAVAEEYGGAGLTLADAYPIIHACGRYAAPLPLANTIVVRAALADAGIDSPKGPLTIASGRAKLDRHQISLMQIPYGSCSDWVVAELDDRSYLLPLAAAQVECSGINRSLLLNAHWNEFPKDAVALSASGFRGVDWRTVGAALAATQMAGAMEKLLEMTVAYAKQRIQFGKPIGKLQVIQQLLSVMAEQVFSAVSAAQIGLSGEHLHPLRAAVAKSRASEAAALVTSTSHAVHGAIGITEEYDLQLYSRRLHEWRSLYGSESYWNTKLGDALLADSNAPLPFIQRISATP